MKWYDKLQNLDRRIIYLLVAIVISIPVVYPLNLPTFYTKPVTQLFDYMENVKDDGVILLSFNHDGAVMPEVGPMVRSVIRHAFLRNIKIMAYCWSLEGMKLGDDELIELANQYGKQWGVDYVSFGYKIPSFPIILGMGSDIKSVLTHDTRGTPTDQIPMMRDIRSYENIDLIVDFGGSSTFYSWILYAHTRFKVDVAIGVTGVVAAETFPLLQTNQLIGLMAGLKDAAEYEQHADEVETATGFGEQRQRNATDLLAKRLQEAGQTVSPETAAANWESIQDYDSRARKGMDSQAIAHLLLIGFIVLGNIGYFASIRDRRKQLGG